MSDEQGKSSADEPGDAWGDAISPERQAELRELADRQHEWVAQPEATRGESRFKGVGLTGADVYWLASRTPPPKPPEGIVLGGTIPILSELHLEGANLARARLAGAQLHSVHLEGAALAFSHCEGATFALARLEGANFWLAHLEGVTLNQAHLEKANLSEACLQGASLRDAQMQGASLSRAQLQDADLRLADMQRSNLFGAKLQGSDMQGAQLQGANLSAARMNVETMLGGVALDVQTQLVDVVWNDAPLTQVDWRQAPRLGDETVAWQRRDENGKPKHAVMRWFQLVWAVRANRVLAVTLRNQGMNEDADRYAYRARVLQTESLRIQKHWGQWLFWGVLWAISGYGYRLWRILAAYGVVLLVFACVYWLMGVHSFPHESGLQAFWDSFLVSLSAIHGRTTFEQLGAWSPTAWAAAVESVVGIVIEGVFVAMLVQRFFAR